MSGIVEVFNKGVGRIVLSFLILVLLTGAVNAVSPNYAELTSPIGFKNNTTSAIAFTDIPKDGLVLWLSFDEGWGYVAHDWSGLGNDGTGYNGSTQQINWTVGVQGGAWKGDGEDDYIDCGSDTSLKPTNAITITAWVKLEDRGDHQFIVDYSNSGALSYGYRLMYHYDAKDYRFGVGNGTTIAFVSTGIMPKWGQWEFITAVYDGQYIKFYINGELVAQNEYTGGIDYSGVNPTLQISRSNYPVKGIIDEVRIYNRALSDEEIKKIYEATKPKYDINKGLVLYLPFDEMSGTVAHDLSGNGNNGQGYNGSTAQINWAGGIYGGAVEFDGVDDYIKIPDNPSFSSWNISNQLTAVAWVYYGKDDGGGWYDILNKATEEFRFAINDASAGDGKFGLSFLVNDGTGFETVGTLQVLDTGKWHFVAVTFDAGIVKFYGDGQLLRTDTISKTKIADTDLKLFIGKFVSKYTPAIIDEVRIYNRSLSDEEIKYLYELGKSKLHLEKGLVLHLTFDEGVGNVTYNYAMTNITINSGKFYGNTSANWTTGMIGKAIEFDGVDDYVLTNAQIDFSKTPFTLSAWVYISEIVSGESFILGERTQVGGDVGLELIDGKPRVRIWNGSFYTATSPTAISTNEWHLITGTFDGNSTLKLYVDGELVVVTDTGGKKPNPPFMNIEVGQIGYTVSYFKGIIDEVRIYNRALSPEEIKALYLLTKNKYDSEFTIVNYTVSITPETPNKLKFTLTPQNELTDIQKLVFLPTNATHTYKTISTETDGYGNTLQSVETSDESPTFTIEIPDLSPAPDGVAMAVWDYKGTLRAVADPNVYSQIEIDWGIFHWILDNFTQMFIHRNNELKVGDLFEFPNVQLTIVASGYISSTDPIEKTDKGLVISGSEFSAIPSADTVIYLEEFNPDKIRDGTGSLLAKFTVDTQYHDEHIRFIITNLPPNTNFTVYKNGTFLKYVVTNESGVLEFEDTGFSPTEIKIELTSPPALAPTAPPEISLEGALSYASYTIAGILVFLAIAFIVKKFKKEGE